MVNKIDKDKKNNQPIVIHISQDMANWMHPQDVERKQLIIKKTEIAKKNFSRKKNKKDKIRKESEMPSSLVLLQPYFSEPYEGVTVEINKELYLFSLREYQSTFNETHTAFLNELQKYSHEEFKIDEHGSAVYFFKTQSTCIQLNLTIDNAAEKTIDIQPFLIYHDETIKNDLDKILELDQLLYNILKAKDLQPS